ALTAGPGQASGQAAGHAPLPLAHGLRPVRRAVDSLQRATWAGGLLAVLFAVLCAASWYRFGSRGWSSLWVVSAMGTISYAVEAALLLLGGALFRRAPLAVALILATLSMSFTVAIGVRLAGSGASTLFLVFAACRVSFSLGLWFLVPPARRLRRLLAEHPDLDLARVLGGARDRGPLADGIALVSLRHRERDARVRERARWIGAGVAAVLVAGSAASWFATRPPTAEELVERFENAWATSNIESVAELFGDKAEIRARQLRSWLTREALEALPSVALANREDLGSRRIRYTYEVQGGELRLGLVHERQRWILNRLVFPPQPE
ncbi:MAG: hypothetical protein V3T22_01045, partial [Planctomycetota bacterium]